MNKILCKFGFHSWIFTNVLDHDECEQLKYCKRCNKKKWSML